jgi:6-pyruvoyltetrahydropterin/6-carboxytetrahydropterin synthase
MYTVAVTHTFEAAHRSPQLGGKCSSLHGHSWHVTVTLGSQRLYQDGTVLDFGPFKKALRRWIDEALDHGTMLAADDPLAPILTAHGCKVYRFGASDHPSGDELYAELSPFPTVEHLAQVLFNVSDAILRAVAPVDAVVAGADPRQVLRVDVREKHDNTGSAIAEPRPAARCA